MPSEEEMDQTKELIKEVLTNLFGGLSVEEIQKSPKETYPEKFI